MSYHSWDGFSTEGAVHLLLDAECSALFILTEAKDHSAPARMCLCNNNLGRIVYLFSSNGFLVLQFPIFQGIIICV